jgi:hypothetical protein
MEGSYEGAVGVGVDLELVSHLLAGLDVDHRDRQLLAADRLSGAGPGVVLPSVKHPVTLDGAAQSSLPPASAGAGVVDTSEVTEGGRQHGGWNRQMVQR